MIIIMFELFIRYQESPLCGSLVRSLAREVSPLLHIWAVRKNERVLNDDDDDRDDDRDHDYNRN